MVKYHNNSSHAMRIPTSIARVSWLPVGGLLKFFFDDLASPRPETPTLGLVLSHGGARGLSHIGVIQVLEEQNIPISVIAGSSMGAYVGALWAAGVSGQELAGLAAEVNDRRALLRLIDPVFPPTSGFVHGHKVRRHIERTLCEVMVEDLKRPMLIVATNLATGASEILRNMPASAAIHASCAIPGICAPVTLNGRRYIDGGASEPLPVHLLRREAKVDHVIAVNVMPTPQDIIDNHLNCPLRPDAPATAISRIRKAISRRINLFADGNVLDTFKRCLTSAQMRITEEETKAADVLIHPFFCESKWYDFENFDRYIKAGREAATAALPAIRALLKSPSMNPQHYETLPIISAVGCRST
jgi:NTE family protein